MQERGLFRNLKLSIYSVLFMTTGEINWYETFVQYIDDSDDVTMHYDTFLLFVILIFLILMPVVMINLLIGLAVGDIAKVQSNALVDSVKWKVVR